MVRPFAARCGSWPAGARRPSGTGTPQSTSGQVPPSYPGPPGGLVRRNARAYRRDEVPGREDSDPAGDVVQLPAAPASPTEIALEELERIYAFAYRRVGNRADAEDLTQQVALKAVPRLRPGASTASIR